MSILPEPIIYPPRHLPSSEEHTARPSAQAAALERLRVNHPELFSLKVTPGGPGEGFLKSQFNIDVTKDGLLEVLLRPFVVRYNNIGEHDGPISPHLIVTESLDKLDINIDDVRDFGYTDFNTNTYAAINLIRAVVSSLPIKTRAQKEADRIAAAESVRRMESDAALARLASDPSYRLFSKMRMGKGKTPIVEADLLGLHSASAAAKPVEIDLLDMNAIRKKEIADDLAGLFGGASRTRKHKQRKHRKARKSRKHSRK